MSFSIVSSGLLCTYMHKKSDTVFCSFGYFLAKMGFLDSSVGKKNPPAMQETLVRFLGQEDPLEKGWATYSSILGLLLWLSW